MFVKYFIPEDGDEQGHPNVFRIGLSQPTVADIKSAFPVPGRFHLRFLKEIGSQTVWFDINDDSVLVPMHRGSIFIKVSRIPSSSSTTRINQRPEPISALQVENASSNASIPSKPPKPPALLEKKTSDKLLKFDDDATVPPSPSQPVQSTQPEPSSFGGTDLLGFDSAPSNVANGSATTNTSRTDSEVDLFGLESLQPTQPGPVPAMLGHNNNNSNNNSNGSIGTSRMMGGSGGPMSANSPRTQSPMMMGGGARGGSMYGQQQQQQQQHKALQQQQAGNSSFGFDPFNNIAGLQQSNSNNNSHSPYGGAGRR